MNNISSVAHQAIQIDDGAHTTMDLTAFSAGAGLRKLVDGEFNLPGFVTLLLIIGVIVFMYWAIKYR